MEPMAILYGTASAGTGNYTWSWQPADKLINPYTQNPITVKLYETTLFRLSVTDNTTGCVSDGEDLVTVVVKGGPLAVTAEITDPLICSGTGTQLHALPSGGNPEYTYTWTSVPPSAIPPVSEPFVYPTANTTYTVEVFDGFNYSLASVNVVVSHAPLVNLGADITACPINMVVLKANNPGMSYYWSNGSIDDSITVGTTGIGFDMKTIWLQVENADGCMATDTINITFDFAQCSGISENYSDTYVYLYPNPTTGKINYEWKGMSGNVQMQISDIHGITVLDQVIQAPLTGDYKGSFSLDGKPDGIYLMRLISTDKVLVRKILLQ